MIMASDPYRAPEMVPDVPIRDLSAIFLRLNPNLIPFASSRRVE
jgi:hypothetical protein